MNTTWIKKSLLVPFLIKAALSVTSCNKSTCPTFDNSKQDKGGVPKASKTKSGVYPKDVAKQMKK